MKVLKLFVREIASILTVAAFLCIGAQLAQAQQFTYPDFSSTSGLQLNGSASVPVGSTILRLTPNSSNQNGSVWYTNVPVGAAGPSPLPLSLGFTTTFALQLSNPGGLGSADGVAFVVQNGSFNGYEGDTTGGTSALAPTDGSGGKLGITGLTNSVAVQFDTWYNSEYGDTHSGANNTFSSADEISVQSCGSGANTSAHGTCTWGRVDLSSLATPIFLADGHAHTAQISYAPPAINDGQCLAGSLLGDAGCGSLTVILDGQTVLTVPFNLASLGLSATDDAYVGFTAATGGGDQYQDLLNWTFAANVTSVVSQPINTTPPPDLPATFNPNPGNFIQTDIDFTTSTGITSPISNPTLLTINDAISQSNTWPQYVAGTPWATSLCTVKAGNGGTDLCSLYVNECFDSTLGPSTASDANCPFVSDPSPTSYVTLKDIFDWPEGGKIQPLPGTTVSLIDFTPASATPSELWNPSASSPNPVCTNVSATVDTSTTPPTITPTQCDITDTLVDVYGDQTTTRGKHPATKGWLVSVYNVPMPLTTVSVLPNPDSACPLSASLPLNNPPTNASNFAAHIWNNGACLLDFVVNPAQPPAGLTSVNNFLAAPPANLLYGPGAPAVMPGPIPEGDSLVSNPNPVLSCFPPNPCVATPWDTGVNAPLSALGGEGSHILHWAANDTVGISEKNVQLIATGTVDLCHNPDQDPALAPPCYNTDYFTTQVNIDNTAPGISAAFSPSGSPAGTFGLNQVVYPVYTCSDALSGVSVCGGQSIASCPLNPAAITASSALDTSTPGNHSYTVTATDCAGNVSQPLTVNYNVLAPPAADVAIFEQETTDYPKHGTNLTYITWALDFSKSSASGVTITEQLPGNAPVGTISAKLAIVSCSLFGCSTSSTGTSCTVTAGTVTCTIGTLPSIYALKGAVVKTVIPISASAPIGSTFKIYTTVSSGNDPNPSNNATVDTITVK